MPVVEYYRKDNKVVEVSLPSLCPFLALLRTDAWTRLRSTR
jgi:hypothetical protein